MAKYWIRPFCLILLMIFSSESWTLSGDTVWAKLKYKGLPDSIRASHLADSAKDAGMLDGLHASGFSLTSHLLTGHSDWSTYFDQVLKTTSLPTFDKLYIGSTSNYLQSFTNTFGLLTTGNNMTVSGKGGVYSCANAYYDGTNWYRIDNTKQCALIELAYSGGFYKYTAPSGSGPISWVGPFGIFNEGNFNPATKSDTSTTNIHFTNYSSSSSIVGFSGTPSKTINIIKDGKRITVFFLISGTSNNSTFTFTVRDTVNEDLPLVYAPCCVEDDGTYLTTPGIAEGAGNVIQIYKDWTLGNSAFTASGQKYARGSISYICK